MLIGAIYVETRRRDHVDRKHLALRGEAGHAVRKYQSCDTRRRDHADRDHLTL